MAQKISYQFAQKRFDRTRQRVKAGGTKVVEVVSELLYSPATVLRFLDRVGPGTAIWQHTPDQHVAAIRIAPDTMFDFSRRYIDLIYSGIDSDRKFKQAWKKANHSFGDGYDPPAPNKSSLTSNVRQQQKSFIVADLDSKHRSKLIPGTLQLQDTADRTHLIPFPIIGIENHPGLLVDYDAWLNRNSMNQFEQKVMRAFKHEQVDWITTIYRSPKGLVWDTYVLNRQHKKVAANEWIDDRWDYAWYFDDYQRNIRKKR